MDGEEKRRDPRIPLVLRVDYPAAPEFFRDATENLSAGGIFIRTDRDLAPGERVALQIGFPGLLEPLEVEVEVVRHRLAHSGEPPGVAVRIPEDRPRDRARVLRLVEAARTGEVPPVRLYRVLVVEDNPHVVEIYEWALRKLRAAAGRVDVQVEYASSGHLALARLDRPPWVDLVIVDLFMPVMDGFTLVERIRGDARLTALPIVVISAGGSEARQRAGELGVDVYLQKPVQFADIVNTVRTLLRIQG
ncbi:MAG TPA: TIGR02266 family protein [Anaeromyxobacteraceae bacterium]|nr:TIGR02266 family protein [Anaeromyxobacteraceae bacterium]